MMRVNCALNNYIISYLNNTTISEDVFFTDLYSLEECKIVFRDINLLVTLTINNLTKDTKLFFMNPEYLFDYKCDKETAENFIKFLERNGFILSKKLPLSHSG